MFTNAYEPAEVQLIFHCTYGNDRELSQNFQAIDPKSEGLFLFVFQVTASQMGDVLFLASGYSGLK